MSTLRRGLPAWVLLAICIWGIPAVAADPKYGPADRPFAVPLSQDHSYFLDTRHPAPDFWSLNSFYVPQATGYSCSVAAAAMVLNGLLNTGRARGDEEKNILEPDLIAKVKGDWQALMSPAGLDGRHGMTLEQLESFLKAGLAAYSQSKFTVVRHEVASASDRELQELRRRLSENESNPRDFILVHFVQDDLTLAKGGPFPHISPVGAYDEARHRVLIFDVDREWYEPYWVSDEALLKAMAHPTPAFGHGGFLWVGRTGQGSSGPDSN
jgi:hypothetical protein